MSLTVQKNTSASRMLSAQVDGKTVPVVNMTGQVTPGKAMSFSVVISDEKLAAANADDVAKAVTAFVEEVRQMAKENGLPV